MATAARTLGDATLQDLRESLSGTVILPDDPAYDDTRSVWNAMHDRRPALLVRCAGADDVATGVHFARSHDLTLAVRSGGHSAAGYGTCDGGLLLDLFPMKAIEIDPGTRIARVESGVLLGELDAAAQAHGLAVPAGQVSHTGVAGLTLGGGTGWLMRKFGLTIDHLRAVELVTADGQQVRASAIEHPDLFWGVRGGGGNFGVVTTFEFELVEVGPMVLGGPILHDIEDAAEVLAFWESFMRTAPDELTSFAVFLTVPPSGPFPEHLWGRQVIVVDCCYAGDLDEGDRVVQPLREHGSPLLDMLGPMPFTVRQQTLDDAAPHRLHYYEKSSFLREIRGGIDALTEQVKSVASPRTIVILGAMGGAVARVAPNATAFPHREEPFLVWIIGAWEDARQSDANVAWVRALHARLEPISSGGVYVNALGTEGTTRVRAAYGADTYDRLARLKSSWDPTNLFRLNQNIKPEA